MKRLIYVVALPVVLLLAACGPSNPLIGQWESEPMMGIVSLVEFKSGSMINSGSIGGMTNSAEVKVKDYKIEKDKVGVVLEQEGATVTMTYNLVDTDTIEQDMGFVKLRLHRKK
ncbi:MAG: hypothetical protein PHP57_07970 [Sideroxydans sp.]|nr:hypothetical protein [Sideroxydans sp.]